MSFVRHAITAIAKALSPSRLAFSHVTITSLFAFACSYHAGSFRDHTGTWPGTTATVGCIDVAVAAGDEPGVSGSVVAYAVGNRCDHRVVVDLTAVRTVARDITGREVTLAAYDPRGELRPLPLNAMWSERARIAYRGNDAAVVSICVDVGGIDRSVAATESWICTAKELR